MRYFLIERTAFSYRDVSVGNWHAINQLGETWEKLRDGEDINVDDLLTLLPAIDVWLQVGDSEIHHVPHLLPTLDWTGGSLGVRMRLEPKDTRKLYTEYRLAREKARTTVAQAGEKNAGAGLSVWPENLLQFLDKRMRALVTVNSYVLDPDKRELPLGVVDGGFHNGAPALPWRMKLMRSSLEIRIWRLARRNGNSPAEIHRRTVDWETTA